MTPTAALAALDLVATFGPIAVSAVVALLVALVPALRGVGARLALGGISIGCIFQGRLPGYLLTMATVLLVAHAVERVFDERSKRWRASCVALFFTVVLFLWTRSVGLQEWRVEALGRSWAFLVLDMWTALRIGTFFWEVGSGKIRAPSTTSFALWALLPFTAAGPVLRFSELNAAAAAGPGPLSDFGWWRKIAVGVAQILIGLALPVLAEAMTQAVPGSMTAMKAARIFIVGPWAFVLTTGGTFVVMEALALLWGQRLPESFNQPFGRRNISDFWANWNMTATRFFRDALFFNRWGMKKTNFYLNTMLVFLCCGAWHAFNAFWLIWGALHGAFFCLFIWAKQSSFARTPLGQALLNGRVGAVVTYVFVCLCWYVPSKVIVAFFP